MLDKKIRYSRTARRNAPRHAKHFSYKLHMINFQKNIGLWEVWVEISIDQLGRSFTVSSIWEKLVYFSIENHDMHGISWKYSIFYYWVSFDYTNFSQNELTVKLLANWSTEISTQTPRKPIFFWKFIMWSLWEKCLACLGTFLRAVLELRIFLSSILPAPGMDVPEPREVSGTLLIIASRLMLAFHNPQTDFNVVRCFGNCVISSFQNA